MTSHLRTLNLHPKPTTGGQVRDSLALPPIERVEGKKWLTSLQTTIIPLWDLCHFQCLLFVPSLGSTIEVLVGAKRVSHHHHFSGQSQTPATIYPLQKGLANQSDYGQWNLWCWKLSRQSDKPVASLTTAMSVGEPRPERSKTHDTILLYRPKQKQALKFT